MIKKSKWIHLKVDEDERIAYQNLAISYKMPLSKLIRLRLADTQPVDKSILLAINKIGNNLNQIAKATNGRDDRVDILKELLRIENILKDFL